MIVGNEIHGLKVKYLHVGGVLGSGEVQNGIRGCIQVRREGGREGKERGERSWDWEGEGMIYGWMDEVSVEGMMLWTDEKMDDGDKVIESNCT